MIVHSAKKSPTGHCQFTLTVLVTNLTLINVISIDMGLVSDLDVYDFICDFINLNVVYKPRHTCIFQTEYSMHLKDTLTVLTWSDFFMNDHIGKPPIFYFTIKYVRLLRFSHMLSTKRFPPLFLFIRPERSRLSALHQILHL